MPDDLDDRDDDLDQYELEPQRGLDDDDDDDGSTLPVQRGYPREEPRGGIGFPVILVALAVLVTALLGVFFLLFRQPGRPAPTPVPPPPVAQATPAPTPAVALPKLEDSDPFVRSLAGALSPSPELKRWLEQPGLVRKLTAVVENVASGETPRPHLEFLAPKQRFKAARRPGRAIVPDPEGFKGYDVVADVVGSVDASAAVAAYRTLAPLFDAAYSELGHPEGGFSRTVERSVAALTAVPVLRDDVELVPHAVGFRYADPKLEGLTAAQKQFLRMGPRNVRIIQQKLRELQQALGAPAAR
jgi:Protein of unknown function (DUF3014)